MIVSIKRNLITQLISFSLHFIAVHLIIHTSIFLHIYILVIYFNVHTKFFPQCSLVQTSLILSMLKLIFCGNNRKNVMLKHSQVREKVIFNDDSKENIHLQIDLHVAKL